MPALLRRSRTYLLWESKREPLVIHLTSMPKKYSRFPRCLRAKTELNLEITVCSKIEEDPVKMISST